MYYQNEIDEFNKEINKTRIIIDMIDRFVVRGRNSNYDIDALVCGTVNDYVWILKYDLYDLILSNRRTDLTSPHIACIRWNYIKENIIEFNKALGAGYSRQ